MSQQPENTAAAEIPHLGRDTARPEPFAIFPFVPLPPNLLHKVTAPKFVSYAFFGIFNLEELLRTAGDFMSSFTDVDAMALRPVLQSFLELAHRDTKVCAGSANEMKATEACWLTFRVYGPDSDYVLPRWHTDGRMFDCDCAEPRLPHSKYAVTLLGPATLVLKPGPVLKQVMDSRNDWYREHLRVELADKLAGVEKIPIRTGEIIRFSWDQDDSPVHSEPNSSEEDRVFVSIMFGSEVEIRDMCMFRCEEFGKVRY